MRWWDYAGLVMAMVAAAGLGGLMGAWAAERRLDRPRLGGYEAPRKPFQLPKITPVNPQKAEDQGDPR